MAPSYEKVFSSLSGRVTVPEYFHAGSLCSTCTITLVGFSFLLHFDFSTFNFQVPVRFGTSAAHIKSGIAAVNSHLPLSIPLMSKHARCHDSSQKRSSVVGHPKVKIAV